MLLWGGGSGRCDGSVFRVIHRIDGGSLPGVFSVCEFGCWIELNLGLTQDRERERFGMKFRQINNSTHTPPHQSFSPPNSYYATQNSQSWPS